MATDCLDHPALCAADVVRGTTRLLLRHDLTAITELPVDGGRRVDIMALGPKGEIVVVEVKVSRADLLGDTKWTDYLAHCDRFYWAVPAGFAIGPLDGEAFLPDRTGVIVADRYDAAIIRPAATVAMPAGARRRCTLAFARRAARRLVAHHDPEIAALVMQS